MSDDKITKQLLKALSEIDSGRMLAYHMPVGRAWSRSFDRTSNLGMLVAGMAVEYYRLGVMSEKISVEMDVDTTVEMLSEWEQSVGIPNACLRNNGDIDTRRRNVKALLTNFGGVQTVDDFRQLASFFGYSVQILPGVDRGGFPMKFPFTLFSSSKAAKFSLLVTLDAVSGDFYFPLPFPIPLSRGGTTFLECIFSLVAPANVKIIAVTFDLTT